MGLKAAVRRRCRRTVGSPPRCWWHWAGTTLIALAQQRLARCERLHGTGRRTIDIPEAGPAGQLVAGKIVAWSFGFTSQFLDRVYRKVEQFDVGIVVAVYLVCIVGVQRE